MSNTSISLKAALFKHLPDPLPPESECWLWTGSLDEGYGRLCYKSKGEYAHRISFTIFTGEELDSSLVIAHLCHEKSCVNPKHLTQVRQQQNIWMTIFDRHTKSRKLTDQQVADIFAAEGKQEDIASKFEVSQTTVNRVKRLRLAMARHLLPESTPIHAPLRHTPLDVMRQIYNAKGTYDEIAEKFQVGRKVVRSVKTLQTQCSRIALPDATPAKSRQTLSDDMLRGIYRAPGRPGELAVLFGVDRSVIYNIKHLKTQNARRAILGII